MKIGSNLIFFYRLRVSACNKLVSRNRQVFLSRMRHNKNIKNNRNSILNNNFRYMPINSKLFRYNYLKYTFRNLRNKLR